MSNVKYYVIPVDGCDQFSAAERLADAHDIDVKDVVFLGSDPSHVFRVPVMQGYEGKAVVVCSNQLCHSKVDIEDIDVKAAAYNETKDIFVLDCTAHIFKEVFSARSVATQNLTPYLKFNIGAGNGWWSVNELLGMYFENINPQPVEFKPEPMPKPEPEAVTEPEPSDFEVETWVPQDELPDNGE